MEELVVLFFLLINVIFFFGELFEFDDGDDVLVVINFIYLGIICIIGLLFWGIGFFG